jgi:N-acetylmuramic acid 6-phosphate etherase
MSPQALPLAGCAYAGARLERHVAADLADLAARGFAGVEHLVSAADAACQRGALARAAALSREAGLRTQVASWPDGPVGAAWLDVALGLGADRVVVDPGREPDLAGTLRALAARGGRAVVRVGDPASAGEVARHAAVDAVSCSVAVDGEQAARTASLLREAAAGSGARVQVWLPCAGLGTGEVPAFEAAVRAATAAGADELWTWAYEAGAALDGAHADAPIVWEAAAAALCGHQGLDALATEGHRRDLADLDLRPTRELVRLMSAEDRVAADAVAAAGGALAAAIDAIAGRLERGGRLVYVGAGSSGRLAAVDAAESGPTFDADGLVIAVVAGGPFAPPAEQEAAEDDERTGVRDLAALGVGARDAVVALSASGRTPYVLGAARHARDEGALVVAVVSARESPLASLANIEVPLVVGPEVITGSTRLKAGTAQKLVLNAISTLTMVRLGRTYGNLMVAVQQSNGKLRARALRAVQLACSAQPAEAEAALAAAGGDPRVAIVALESGVDAAAARSRLEAAGWVVRRALAGGSRPA